MFWLLIAIGVLAGLGLTATLIGSLLPVDHIATRSLKLRQAPQTVWQTITDYPGQTQWRADLQRVERLPDRNGHEVWLEEYGRGMKIPLETIEAAPPQRLVRLIADDELAFGGTWEYTIAPAADGACQLTITERGKITNPLFRFLSRFVFGYTATIETYLKSLAGKFGEAPDIR